MTEYYGWIKAKEADIEILKGLGVKGPMIYNHKNGSFEHCLCGEAAMHALMLGWPDFWPGSFVPYFPYWSTWLEPNWSVPAGWPCERCRYNRQFAWMRPDAKRCTNCGAYRNLTAKEAI